MQDLFSEFPGLSTEEWLAKIEKELKGKAPESLDWEVDGLTIKPFYRREDQEKLDKQVLYRPNNNWAIEEDVVVKDVEEANKQALDALLNGVESLNLIIDEDLDEADLKRLFKDIQVPWIDLKLSGKIIDNSPTKFFPKLAPIICPNQSEIGAISGTLNFNASQFIYAFYDEANFIVDDFKKFGFPAFRTLMIDCTDGESVIYQLASTLSSLRDTIAGLKEFDLNFLQNNLHFRFPIGKSFFMEIAKLRAFKLLYPQVIQAFAKQRKEEVQLQLPYIHAYTASSAYDEDTNSNMIRSTTLTMSGVLGGANSLTVTPTGSGEAFNRRIARNVQHLLKHESYLDRVSDPAAGSYYIETLTDKLARAAWAKFQTMPPYEPQIV